MNLSFRIRPTINVQAERISFNHEVNKQNCNFLLVAKKAPSRRKCASWFLEHPKNHPSFVCDLQHTFTVFFAFWAIGLCKADARARSNSISVYGHVVVLVVFFSSVVDKFGWFVFGNASKYVCKFKVDSGHITGPLFQKMLQLFLVHCFLIFLSGFPFEQKKIFPRE